LRCLRIGEFTPAVGEPLSLEHKRVKEVEYMNILKLPFKSGGSLLIILLSPSVNLSS